MGKVEWYRFRISPFLWVLAAVSLLFNVAPMVLSGHLVSTAQVLEQTAKNIAQPLLLCMIYTVLTVTEDFENGFVRCYLASGKRWTAIVAAKLLHALLGATILLLLNVAVPVLSVGVVQGGCDWLATGRMLAQMFPFWVSMTCVFFVIAILAGRQSLGVVIAAAVVFVLTILTNWLGTNPILYRAAVQYSPIAQLEISGRRAAAALPLSGAYWTAAGIAAATAGVMVVAVLCKKDPPGYPA